MNRMDSLKLALANTGSWIATIVSMQYMKDVAQLVALLGSIAVSIASVWWISRQAESLKRKDK